jgi:di/tricarboxylate transporter
MTALLDFYGYFNVVLGTIMMLIGWKVYKPFRKDREEEVYAKYQNLYRYGGVAMVIWGLIRIL